MYGRRAPPSHPRAQGARVRARAPRRAPPPSSPRAHSDEADALPDVLTSRRAARPSSRPLRSLQPEFDACLPPPAGLEVDDAWAAEFLASFADVRQSLRRWDALRRKRRPAEHKLPALSDAQAWCRICGWATHPSGEPVRGSPPTLALVLELEPLAVQTLVRMSADWLEAAWEEQGAGALQRPRALWLFALLARLDADLLADTAARLRLVFRVLTRVRARHGRADAASTEVAELNVLLLILARYFRQAAPGEW